MDGLVLSPHSTSFSPHPELAQRALARFNRARLSPGVGVDMTSGETLAMLHYEEWMLHSLGRSIKPFLYGLPTEPEAFMKWFRQLKETGPGQGDALFPWLAEEASFVQLR